MKKMEICRNHDIELVRSVIRTFHPVGQGAFYSEKHTRISDGKKINIVYDCGSNNIRKGKEAIVNDHGFRNTDVIDILFISHLHHDHISLVEKLKESVKEIRYVVLPLLHKNEALDPIRKGEGVRNMFINLWNVMHHGEENPYRDIEKYFGTGETKFIYVEVDEDIKENVITDEEMLLGEMIDIDSVEGTIHGGTQLCIDNDKSWVFIPRNYQYGERRQELLNKLKEAGLDFRTLETCVFEMSKEDEQKVKKCYKSLGDLNEDSMLVYSGPPSEFSGLAKRLSLFDDRRCCNCDAFCGCFHHLAEFCPCKRSCNCDVFCGCFHPHRVACVYTGDANLKRLILKSEYKQVWRYIGTIQIPHHGSEKSFSSKVNDFEKMQCPISAGKNNHEHPACSVITELKIKHNCPILVKEERSSEYRELIELWASSKINCF